MILKILELVEKVVEFLNKLIEDWQKGNRRRVLLVGFVVLFIFCASQQEWLKSFNIPLIKDVPQFIQPPWINILWILPGILLIWVIYESRKPPPPAPPEPTEFKESTAIKGLRSFTEKDREIFKQLQRNQVLQECLAEINRDNFQFGILFGESGCGKTSFIQAGLIPQLSQADSKVQGIYVRFSERDPLVTIRQAFVEKLPLFPEDINQLDFLPLLSQGVEAASKPLVLIFDQFEQFFVHFKRKKDRQFFIQALTDWYKNPQLPQVKILVSIRKDFYAYLVELQKGFGDSYALSPQEVIELENFSPEEATNVIEVIALTTEGLEIDRQFTQKVAEQELASGEDGLISPVYLQLLAWIINGQKASELRGFNEKAFQKLGGIEGLLSKFLERTLQARITENQRQATIKVLRSLTDAERRVRAGILTFEEVQKKLPELPPNILQETINWLKADGVRLITPVEREGIIGYELAHEKMIPAFLKLAEQELPEADKANQLLERRVNEWLSNDCDPYYLLRWRELQLIQKQKLYLKWGINRQHKQHLIAKSKRRFQKLFSQVIGLLIIMGLFWLGAEYYLATPKGEIQQTRWELNRVSKLIDNDNATAEVAIAIAKDGNLKKSLDIITNQIDDPYPKARVLSWIAEAIGQLNQSQEGIRWLESALSSANQIDNSNSKATALKEIAEAIGQLNQPQEGIRWLESALSSANQIDDPYSKARALREIAEAYGQLNQPQKGITLLESALASANQIDDPYPKARVLSWIAEAYGQLNQSQEGIRWLESALASANQIDDSYSKARALREIAEAIGQLNQPQKGITLLESALASANQIDYSYPKARALREIAEAYGQLNQSQEGIRWLESALSSANQIDDSYSKARALKEIAEAYGQLNQPQEGIRWLESALSSANQIDDPYSKARVLREIAEVYAKFESWGEARKASEKITIQYEKAMSLAKVLTTWVETQYPELAPKINSTSNKW